MLVDASFIKIQNAVADIALEIVLGAEQHAVGSSTRRRLSGGNSGTHTR